MTRDFVCAKCKKGGRQVELKEELCDEVETVTEFCFLGDGLSAIWWVRVSKNVVSC